MHSDVIAITRTSRYYMAPAWEHTDITAFDGIVSKERKHTENEYESPTLSKLKYRLCDVALLIHNIYFPFFEKQLM